MCIRRCSVLAWTAASFARTSPAIELIMRGLKRFPQLSSVQYIILFMSLISPIFSSHHPAFFISFIWHLLCLLSFQILTYRRFHLSYPSFHYSIFRAWNHSYLLSFVLSFHNFYSCLVFLISHIPHLLLLLSRSHIFHFLSLSINNLVWSGMISFFILILVSLDPNPSSIFYLSYL